MMDLGRYLVYGSWNLGWDSGIVCGALQTVAIDVR